VPTYQYVCTACGVRHEAVQSFSDAPLTECPACGGALRKVFSAVGVVFKGSGFYKNDSRAGTGGSKADADASAGTSSGDASGGGASGGGKEAPAAASGDTGGAAKTPVKTPATTSGNGSSGTTSSSTPASKSA
jgi:putative FmdB family regulatory protein